jgi:hypothetical protein
MTRSIHNPRSASRAEILLPREPAALFETAGWIVRGRRDGIGDMPW